MDLFVVIFCFLWITGIETFADCFAARVQLGLKMRKGLLYGSVA